MGPETRVLQIRATLEGTFASPKMEEIGAAKLALRPDAFAMLSDGIDLRGGEDWRLACCACPPRRRKANRS